MNAPTETTRVVMLTRSYHIKGCLDLPPGARVTDFLIAAKGFIAVTDAEVWTLDGTMLFKAAFIDVHRDHIEIITPAELASQG